MANGFIGQVHIGNDDFLIGSTLFATCSTTASTGTKEAVLQSSAPYTSDVTGITVHVLFTNANTETDADEIKLKLGTTTAHPIINPNGAVSWKANSIISFTFDGTSWVMNSTGIDGSSIQNLSLGNITSEGKLTGHPSSLVVTNSSSEITAGAAFETVNSQTQSTKFLRSDGTWAAPSYTTNTDTTVIQTAKADDVAYKLLFSAAGANPTSGTAYEAVYYTGLTFNPSTKTLSINDGTNTGTLTATNYSGTAAKASAIAWSGITSTPITLSGYGITDALSTSSTISIAGNSINLNGGSIDSSTLRNSLGLSQALRFIGTVNSSSTYKPSDGTSGTPTITGKTSYTPAVGDVVLYDDYEYVCVSANNSTYTWERLGGDSSFALDSEVIKKDIFTAAGQIIYASSANSPVVLDKGSDGYVLTIDSTSHLPTWKANSATSSLYVNATAGGAANNTATANTTTYIHLYNDTTKKDTIKLTGAGGTSIHASDAKVITITSKTYTASNVSVLKSLTLKYNNGTAHTETPSSDTYVAAVNNGILYIKSIVYGTETVNQNFGEEST